MSSLIDTIGQLTQFTNLGIDLCLFSNSCHGIEDLNRRSCTDAYLFISICVQLSRLRSLVVKSQTIFVCAFLLSTLVTIVLLLWTMTKPDTSLRAYFLVFLLSKPLIDLIYSSVDYTDKVNL